LIFEILLLTSGNEYPPISPNILGVTKVAKGNFDEWSELGNPVLAERFVCQRICMEGASTPLYLPMFLA